MGYLEDCHGIAGPAIGEEAGVPPRVDATRPDRCLRAAEDLAAGARCGILSRHGVGHDGEHL
jgi:hypothetical protein